MDLPAMNLVMKSLAICSPVSVSKKELSLLRDSATFAKPWTTVLMSSEKGPLRVPLIGGTSLSGCLSLNLRRNLRSLSRSLSEVVMFGWASLNCSLRIALIFELISSWYFWIISLLSSMPCSGVS